MDINNVEIFLPISVTLLPISAIMDDTAQTIDQIIEEGFSFTDFIDDQVIEIAEPKNIVPVPTLGSTGALTRKTYSLSQPATISIPINAWNYSIEAIRQGRNTGEVINDGGIKVSATGAFDATATMVDRPETILQESWVFLAEITPEDPDLGRMFIMCPKCSINKDTVNSMVRQQYFADTIDLAHELLTDTEQAKWVAIFDQVKKRIPIYKFHVKMNT